MKTTTNPSPVTATPPAPPSVALAHFERLLALETDCWDVHQSMANGRADFVLLDVRSPALFAAGRVPGAVNLPHGRIVARTLADHPPETVLVVYCAGPTATARTAPPPASRASAVRSRRWSVASRGGRTKASTWPPDGPGRTRQRAEVRPTPPWRRRRPLAATTPLPRGAGQRRSATGTGADEAEGCRCARS